MEPDDSLRDLLPSLYATPLDASNWQIFLDRLSQRVEVSSAYVVSSSAKTGNLCLAGGGGDYDPEAITLYNDHFGKNDPFRAGFLASPKVGVIHGEELVSQANLMKTELWNELLLPKGLHHVTMLCGTCNAKNIETLSLWRNSRQGPLDLRSIQLLQSLSPHIQTVLRLNAQLRSASVRDALSETALNAVEVMVMLVNGSGRILHMNSIAATRLPTIAGIEVHAGKLVASNPLEASRLQELLQRATAKSGSVSGGAMKLRHTHSAADVQVSVIPTAEEFHIDLQDRCAIVFMSDPQSAPRLRGEFMRQVYGLTATEARLADCLLEGNDLRGAADQLSMTWSTARFHLKRIFAKTNTCRQAELMRLMLVIPVMNK